MRGGHYCLTASSSSGRFLCSEKGSSCLLLTLCLLLCGRGSAAELHAPQQPLLDLLSSVPSGSAQHAPVQGGRCCSLLLERGRSDGFVSWEVVQAMAEAAEDQETRAALRAAALHSLVQRIAEGGGGSESLDDSLFGGQVRPCMVFSQGIFIISRVCMSCRCTSSPRAPLGCALRQSPRQMPVAHVRRPPWHIPCFITLGSW